MKTASDILSIAKKELGVKESPANSNNVKYNTAYYGKKVVGSAYPWCMAFVWWVFKQAKASDLFYGGKKTASCTALMNYAKKNGQWVTKDFKAGDLVLFQFDKDAYADHVGIVESASGTKITAIEGNTSASGSQSNGGQVMRKTRSLSLVLGAYRPKYETKGGEDTVILPTLKKGSKGDSVKALQVLLNGYGYSCGTVDGEFGSKTLLAVKKYQKAKGLTQDGICGKNTWNALLV